MVATPIAPSSRYYRPGTTKLYVADPIAAFGEPTRADLDGATDVSGEVAEITGFMVVSASIETPDFGTRFTSKIPSAVTADDSSLIFYADVTSADIRALLQRDQEYDLFFLDEGDVAAQLMDQYRVRVASVPKLRDRDEAARTQVDFTIVREPAENIAIPAAV